jgi:hypothetical protein
LIRRLLARLSCGLVIGLAPGLLVIGVSGAHPAYADGVATPPRGISDIVNIGNGKCLSEENVGPVIDTCDGTDRQDWNVILFGNTGIFLLQNHLTGNCLSVLNNNPNEGAQVNTHTCDMTGNDAFEDWLQKSNEITNDGDNFNLAIQPSGCGAANELPIYMNDFNHCLADQWRFPGD